MKMIGKLVAASGLVSMSTGTMAAVEPYYQSQYEIEVIIGSNKLADLFGPQQAIESVVRKTDITGRTFFEVSSESCRADVEVQYVISGDQNPVSIFKLEFPSQLICD